MFIIDEDGTTLKVTRGQSGSITFGALTPEGEPYTFVGRYSTSNVCAYCPPGFAYFEYQLDGTIDREFTDKEEWIKVQKKQ